MKVHAIMEVPSFFFFQLFWMLEDAAIFASIIPKEGRTSCSLLSETASLETRIEMIAPSLILLHN